ncbi:hypothetical protein Galf_0981 [Gallionella capsiferriformans ES-2]|uniref:Uncharacterized protein n=1 Tax=Gallionella capsiferriformans (strain ES-2) TaxID=395494 RepID=D9SER5_GALCS|nr:hypothetical protein Galf_0981 [Gallionella capsiferriformans ES-2]
MQDTEKSSKLLLAESLIPNPKSCIYVSNGLSVVDKIIESNFGT